MLIKNIEELHIGQKVCISEQFMKMNPKYDGFFKSSYDIDIKKTEFIITEVMKEYSEVAVEYKDFTYSFDFETDKFFYKKINKYLQFIK